MGELVSEIACELLAMKLLISLNLYPLAFAAELISQRQQERERMLKARAVENKELNEMRCDLLEATASSMTQPGLWRVMVGCAGSRSWCCSPRATRRDANASRPWLKSANAAKCRTSR